MNHLIINLSFGADSLTYHARTTTASCSFFHALSGDLLPNGRFRRDIGIKLALRILHQCFKMWLSVVVILACVLA